jgi:hypothetical protein
MSVLAVVAPEVAPELAPEETAAAPQTPFIWQGRPGWRSAAFRIWRVRLVAAWFCLLLLDGLRLFLVEPHDRPRIVAGALAIVVVGLAACAILVFLAWLTGRTTQYAVGDGQVKMRFGIALKATLIIPYCAIERVGVRIHGDGDGAGDVALRLKPGRGVFYPKLWPHVRPWSLFRPEPTLRCVPEAGVVATRLSRAIAQTEAARARWLASAQGSPLLGSRPDG